MGIKSPQKSGQGTRRGKVGDAVKNGVDARRSGGFHVLGDGLECNSHFCSRRPPADQIGDKQQQKNQIVIREMGLLMLSEG